MQMHRMSHNNRTTVCGESTAHSKLVQTRRGPRMEPVQYTDLPSAVRCRECREIVAQYELAYGPYTAAQ